MSPLRKPIQSEIIQPLEKSVQQNAIQRNKISSCWGNRDDAEPLSGRKKPVAGVIRTLTHSSGEQNLQSLDKSFRSNIPQKDKTSNHWRNHPAKTQHKGIKPPASGGIRTPKTSQTPKTSREWRNYPAKASVKRGKHPASGEIRTPKNFPDAKNLQRVAKSPR